MQSQKSFINDNRGLFDAIEVIKVLVMIVVVGAIGIFIADKTLTASGTIANQTLVSMLVNVLSAANTGSSFVVILIIAFIGGLALTYFGGVFTNRR